MRLKNEKKIAIIGLGYVGLPLAVEFGKKYKTIGFDINTKRVEELNNGIDKTLEVDSIMLNNVFNIGNFIVTSNIEDIRDCNIFIVTVPTPTDKNNRPVLTPLINASELIGSVLKKDDIVIYESTVYPGVTEDVCVPVLEEKSNLKYNIHFFAGYSPERINPGDKERTVVNILKVTSGSTSEIADVVDELYKAFADEFNPTAYAPGLEELIDGILEEIGFVRDSKSTWWEVTDALFSAGFIHEAMLAQRYAMPLLADAASICRTSSIEDLYEKIVAPTGESLINAFSRMISGAVREYSILSRVTSFDMGDARVVSLDLDEVAKSGGDAADRQTSVMYMLARYVLARHYYLTEESITTVPDQYKEYHKQRIMEIREDPKRIVYDEFHRTSKSKAVRDQVIVDMREGRKWKVQIALLSQSVDDFDPVMIEFATSIYIMDAGPSQTVDKTTQIFGLSGTAKAALRTRVHGPRQGGATFLVQYATKTGLNIQLLTLTLGPIELWAFSTTAEDTAVRNQLYRHLGPSEARRVLSTLFPNGTIAKEVEDRLAQMKGELMLIEEDAKDSVIQQLVAEVLDAYAKDPNVQMLTGK